MRPLEKLAFAATIAALPAASLALYDSAEPAPRVAMTMAAQAAPAPVAAAARLAAAPVPRPAPAGPDAAEVYCLAEVIYYEARSAGDRARRGVAEVVRRRRDDPRRRTPTICETAHAPAQFHGMALSGGPKTDAAAWRDAQRLAAEALSPGWVPVVDADHFWSAREDDAGVLVHGCKRIPPWVDLDVMELRACIGPFQFAEGLW